MKKIIVSVLSLLSASVFAAPYEMYISQLNGAGNDYIGLVIQEGSSNGIMYYNNSTHAPSLIGLGTGLSVSSGNLNVSFPSLATVATSGSYNDLTNKPTIPSAQVNSDWNSSSGVSQILNKPDLSGYATTSSLSNYVTSSSLTSTLSGYVTTSSLNSGARSAISLTTTGTSGSATYNSSTGVLNIPNYASGSGTVTSVTAGSGLSGGTITTTGTISLPNTGTAGAYSGVTTDSQGRVTAGTNRSYNYTTRSLNNCFQVSSSRDALVTYSVDIATSLSLTSGQQGTVYLEIFTNNGCTTGTQEITRFVNGQTGTLTIGLALTQNVTGTLTGVIPAGSYVKLRTENNTGSPTFTGRSSQEVLL